MSGLAQPPFISVENYLAGEEVSPIKHEYVAGEVFAMAGANEAHVTIALNVAAMLRAHVRGGPCRVYISDMKLRVARAESFFYPDVFVTCDPADTGESQAKQRATLVIEVLSESTEAYDRGAKFARYRQLDSLLEYILIDAERQSIDVFRRREDHWLLCPVSEGERLELASMDFGCPIADVYEDVRFEPSQKTP